MKEEVKNWVKKANNDLKVAKDEMKTDSEFEEIKR